MPFKYIATNISPETQVILAKMIGAVAGAMISLAYILPQDKREAGVRFLTGFCAGIVFGMPVGFWIATYAGIQHVLSRTEIALLGAAIASLSIWTALGIAFRFAHNFGRVATQQPNSEKEGKNDR